MNVLSIGFGVDCDAVGIELDCDVSDLFSNSLKFELINRHYNISSGGFVLDVEIHKFQNEFKSCSFTGKSEAELILFVQVKTPSENVVYSRVIVGKDQKEIYMALAYNAKLTLEAALNDAIYQLFGDPLFLEALHQRCRS